MNSSQFADTRLIEYPQAHPLVVKLLARYGLRFPPEKAAQSAILTVQIALPHGSAMLWDRATSLERNNVRRELLRAVSLTLQDTLRCWIPYLWLSYPPNWHDRDLVWPMLIYASSRTFKPLSRENFAFDLLDDDTLPTLLRSSLPVLKHWVPLFQAIHHQRAGPRREFRMDRLLRVVEQADFDPYYLKRLLAHERKLIAAFMDLADGQSPEHSVERFGMLMQRHLSRIYTNADFTFLAPLLYIEMENTLAKHLLGQPILDARLAVAEPPPDVRPLSLRRLAAHSHRALTTKQPNLLPSVHLS